MHNFLRRPCCAVAALILTGCAGTSPYEWDDSLYRRIVDRPSTSAGAERADAAEVAPRAPVSSSDTDTDSDAELSVEEAVQRAIMNHPALRRAAYGVRAAAGRETQSRLYPNPAFAFEAEGLGAQA